MSIFSTSVGARLSRRFCLGTVFASGALASFLAASPALADDLDDAFADTVVSARDVTLHAVELRHGVTADIHLRVLSHPFGDCGRRAIVAVPGAASSADSLVSMGEAILALPDDGGERACRFISVDLPGHGASPPPVGVLFGDLTLDDYTAAVLGTLDRLEDQGIRTTTLMGHSMGGMVVQLAQQSLVSGASSLRDSYDVKHVVLFAPAAWPGGASCAVCTNPQVAAAIGQFASFDPVLGPSLELPAAAYLGLTWSTPEGTLAPDAPTAAEIAALGYVSDESLTALGGLLGTPPMPRATFNAGIFSSDFGTRLDVVSFQNDTLVQPSEAQANYQYSTGESPEQGFTMIAGADAVHGMPISDAAAMLTALAGQVRFH